jgi:hypothetical protein
MVVSLLLVNMRPREANQRRFTVPRHLGLVDLHLAGLVFTDHSRIKHTDYAVKVKLLLWIVEA